MRPRRQAPVDAPALIERGVGRGSAGQRNAVQPVAGKSLGGAACKRRPAEGVQDEAGALDDRDLRLRLEGPFESGNLHLRRERSEEPPSELPSLMRTPNAV